MEKKKVLIISYYWPPCGGIGVLRCLKIAKYLRDFGWEPIIYTVSNGHYPSLDNSNDKDIPEGVTILRQPIWEPYTWYKKLTGQRADANVNNVFYASEKKNSLAHRLSVWIRSNFFIPDARRFWIKPSVRYLLAWLQENPVDAIFSDGPPHSNTRIATLLSQKTGIPWLADYQDPWTQVDYYQLLSLTALADKKHRRLEQEAFQTAACTTIVSPTWKRDLESIGAKNVHVIPWGFDPDDYPAQQPPVRSGFTFFHAGIVGYDRNPSVFLEVARKLAEQDTHFAASFSVELLGLVDTTVQECVKQTQTQQYVQVLPSVPRNQALEMTLSSPVLLLLLNQQDNAKGRIPGKLFEYLAAKRPILVLGPTDSDVASIVQETGRGRVCAYNDAHAIEQALLFFWKQHQTGELLHPVSGDIDAYSIRNLTKKVAGLLEDIQVK